ncbi:P27 family phage terminase small subunit [Ruegeria sp. HKCCSP351]|uniref:P27 family phage terminase small subunit n=1 Tax=Ruegeria sp. HKCCSP351 TaxID=2794832 RepID=UPI001AE82D50|nr:P27 family phage terminase small subunit [Ruegeria sp. HKCCSP351]
MPNPTTSEKSQLTAIQNQTAETVPFEVPIMPESLNPAYWAEWDGLIRHLHRQEAWTPEKASVVETYIINLAAIRSAQMRMTLDGGPIGPDGKQHPASAIIVRHSGALNKLGEQLGLGKGKLLPVKKDEPQTPGNSVWQA